MKRVCFGNFLAKGPQAFRSLLFLLFVAAIPIAGFSQLAEVCNNGVDDDFDGFIDCYDGSCATNPACDGLFVGNDASCQAIPPQFPAFTMALDFSSPNETTNHLSRLVIGDYDRDGIPEIATMNRYTKRLFILRGSNGSIKYQATVNFEPYWEIATANIDNDNCAELFFIGYLPEISHTERINGRRVVVIDQYEGVYMFAYDCQLNFLWRTVEPFPQERDPINYGVADFDGDGQVEIYAKDEIYDAKTGIRLIKSTAPDYEEINGGPVAINMSGDAKLELVIGLAIYQVNLGPRTLDAGSLTLLQKRNDYFIRYPYNATSVADYNLDGNLDVIASGSTIAHGRNTTVFFWDVTNNTIRTYSDPLPALGSDYTNGWINGTGRLNIADLDGNGLMNVSYVSGRFLYALNENFNLLWKARINEETSGYTGCTLFDFNGDGKAEIVYRDERFLYIINGTDGTNYQNPQPCIARTNREYPIVADVDADGSTEICVTCGFNNAAASANFNNLSYSRYSHVRVFKSAAEPWVPARRVWNQHGYFIVNVNDDLTIPRVIQPHHTVWSVGSCTTGPNRPLNKFLNQSPFLNSKGCPTYAAINLGFSSIVPTITPPQCPNTDFTVSLQITNLGDVELTGNIPISFYTSDPRLAGATWLKTITVPLTNFGTNDTYDITNLPINANGSNSLFLVLNDAGTSIPTPITLPNGTYFECDYTDNVVGASINPLPVTMTALEVTPHNACTNAANGAARAFVPIAGGGENTADYNFYWFNGTVAGPIGSANFVGPIYSGIPDGTYTVFARHKTAGCNSNAVQVVVGLVPGIPAVNFTVIQDQTSCVPLNGQLTALVVGGNAGFTFSWFDIALNPLGISGPVANNLVAGTYVVLVSRNGCNKLSDPATIAGPQIPDATAVVLANVADCSNPNSGSIQADALIAGAVQNPANYTFDWYFYNNATSTKGSILPPANGTGPIRTGLAAGYYQAVVKDNATGCVSGQEPVVQVLDQTILPTATISEVTPQTSCDPTNPNGVMTAAGVAAGLTSPTDFTFEWFKGDNTLPANKVTTVSGLKGETLNQVSGGGVFYTVKVTTAQNCSATNKLIISENVVVPVLTLIQLSPNTVCDPTKASTPNNGSIQATVTFGASTVTLPDPNYLFTWHNGPTTADPVIAVADPKNPILTGLMDGSYTATVTRTDRFCTSVPKTQVVAKTTVLPVLSLSSTGSHNCDASKTPDGTATVVVTNAVGTDVFTYLWTAIAPASAVTVAANNANQPTAIRLGGPTNSPNQYEVTVTNSTSGCQSVAAAQVADISAKPTLTLQPFPNTVCDKTLISPGPGQFNGHADITAVNNNTGTYAGPATLTYQWFDVHPITSALTPNVTSPTNTTASLTLLNGAKYATQVSITELGCVSDPVTTEVLNNPTPIAPVSNVLPSTNCTPGLVNGRAEVTAPIGANFSYEWYNGGTVDPPQLIVGATNPLLGTNLQGTATFTIQVTNRTDGCRGTATMTVVDAKVVPTISLTKTSENLNCTVSPPNGSLLATVLKGGVALTPPYTIAWSPGGVQAGANGEQYTQLAAGAYSATVTETATGCQSSADSESVADNLVYPTITVAINDQTTCSGTPNGRLTVTTVAAHTYTWYDGVGTGGGVHAQSPAASGIINQLVSGDYTVEAISTATGCSTTESFFVPDNVVNPTLSFVGVGPVTSCVTPNGTATASVTVSAAPLYDIFYVFTSAASGGASPTDPAVIKASVDPGNIVNGTTVPSPAAYGGMIPGYLTALVVDKNTQCESTPVTQQIVDNTVKSNITVVTIPVPGLCGGGLGGIDPTVTPLPAASYTYEWYVGTPTNVGSIDFFTNPPTFSTAQIYGDNGRNLGVNHAPVDNSISAGTYTLVVYDPDGCGTYHTDNVPTISAPVISVTPVDVNRCDIDNGQLNAMVTSGTSAAGYSIEVFSGNDATGALLGSIGFSAINTNLNVPNLQVGPYFVRIVDGDSPTCPLGENQSLISTVQPPLITVDQILPNTSCDANVSPDGKVQITVDSDAGDLTAKLYHVSNISPLPVGFVLNPSPGNIIGTGASGQSTGLMDGFKPQVDEPSYTITVTDDNSKCTNDVVVIIPNAQDNPSDLTVTSSPESFCGPATNGSALASVAPDPATEFDFEWYSDNALTNIVNDGIANPKPGNGLGTGGELLNQGKIIAPAVWPMGPTGQGSPDRIFFVRGKKNATAATGAGCYTQVVQVTIEDQHVSPDMTLTGVFNSFCAAVGGLGDGEITVAADADPTTAGQQNSGGGFDYVWTNANGALASPQLGQSNNFIIPQLFTGSHQVTATNADNQCQVQNTVTVDQAPYVISVNPSIVIDQRICNPDGQIDLTAITIDQSAAGTANIVETNLTPLTAQYDFEWYKANPATPGTFTVGQELRDGPTGTGAIINDQSLVTGVGAGQFAAMSAGTYYVVATRKSTAAIAANCPALPHRVEVEDVHQNPVPAIASFSNTSCLAGSGEGSIEIGVTDNTTILGPFTYTYTWVGPGPIPVVNPGSGDGDASSLDGDDDVYTQLDDGVYNLTVSNDQSGCQVVASVTVLQNVVPVFVQSVTTTDQVLCGPDGSLTVTQVTLNNQAGTNLVSGVDFPISDFEFDWKRTASAFTQTTPGTVLNTATYNAVGFGTPLGFDTYTVVARRITGGPGRGCSSGPFEVDIEDGRLFPLVAFTSVANSSCNAAKANGSITVNASETSGANAGPYLFVWTLNGGALPPPSTQTDTNNSSLIGSAVDGNYLLVSTNTVTGCPVTANFNLLLDQIRSTPNIIDVNTVDPLDCTASAMAEVTKITIGSATNSMLIPPSPNNEITGAGLLGFNYSWFDGGIAPADQLPVNAPCIGPGCPVPTAGLLPGLYYVFVQDPTTDCVSGPKEVAIKDDAIIYPVVTITQTMKQISCTATSGTAALSAAVVEEDASVGTYDFTWYSSLDLSGPAFGPPSATNPNVISNLSVGNYSVDVQNTVTLCKASALYIVPDDVPQFKPIMALSSQPLTLCTAQDGFVNARVVAIDPSYPFPLSYTADLYFGSNPNLAGPPDIPSMNNLPGFTTSFIESALAVGAYTVRITDNNTSCTVVETISVLDEREFPEPVVEIVAPNVNCDPLRPNGVARVLVDGTFLGFQFEWHEGNTVAGVLAYTGAEFGELKPQDYTIQATNLTTGCTGTVLTTMPNESLPIPMPTILKVSDVTSCVVDNGILSVSVGPDKVTSEYIFDWHDGTVENPPPDFVGEIYSDLSTGTYSVTATSRITGCKSPLVSEDILDAKVYPDFEFQIVNPSCGNNNGSATLLMTSNVEVGNIEWANGTGPFQVGPNLSEVVAGTYTVTVTSLEGCITTKDVEILPDVRPFNGISRNGDNQNDFFQIDCIQDFPNNIVKIYNRAGTLVFEAVGYDNATVLFDGKSNRGVSIMGTHLPDGTYFYIVDKRNGSKPVAGYLELVE